MNNDRNSLAHTTWNCKYHIVFAPKYRRKVFYEQNREEVGKDSERTVQLEEGNNSSGGDMPRPYSHACRNSSENERFGICRISERKKQFDSARKTWKLQI